MQKEDENIEDKKVDDIYSEYADRKISKIIKIVDC